LSPILISVGLVILGTLVGFASSFALERVRRREAILSKLFDHYIKVREEVVEVVSKLAITEYSSETEEDSLQVASRKISYLFYRHYDLLPRRALLELACLYSCLAGEGRHFYYADSSNRLRRLNPKDSSQALNIARELSLFTNVHHFAILVLMSKDSKRRRTAIVNYQARKVLRALNEEFTLTKLFRLEKHLPKEPAAHS
jgi:hypothetical protein